MPSQKINGFLLILLLMNLSACDYFNGTSKDDKGIVVAAAYEAQLFEKDLEDLNLKDLNTEDSLAVIRQFVDNWTREKASLHQAVEQLPKDKISRIEQQVEDYRNSLILFLYENELVNQKLDTMVQDYELENYFTTYPDNFKLRENIVKARYFIVDTTSLTSHPELSDTFKKAEPNDENEEDLQAIGYTLNAAFNLAGQWFSFNEMMQKFPIETSRSTEKFLKNNTYLSFTDSLNHYFIHIDEYHLQGTIPPLDYCRENVRSLVLKKRQTKLLDDTKKNIYRNAVQGNQITINIE